MKGSLKDRLQALLEATGDDAIPLIAETVVREADAIIDRALASVPFHRKLRARQVPVLLLQVGDYAKLARDGYLAPIPQRVYTLIKEAGLYPEIEEIGGGFHMLYLPIAPDNLL